MNTIGTAKPKSESRRTSFMGHHAVKAASVTPAWKLNSLPISAIEVHSRINKIKKGYSIVKFDQLKEALGVNKEKLARIASISLATMHRRKIAMGRLTSNESEKIYRLEKLYETALEILEDKGKVKSWFNTSQIVFEGKTPLEYADTLPGSEEVERVLRRMEHGIVL
jgi:putative toxin-antitoxin system antitoxin component (TIGR02293 family)